MFELQDGSALFVTVARYQTPKLNEIDGTGTCPVFYFREWYLLPGITPDLACFPDKVSRPPKGEGRGVEGPAVAQKKSTITAELELDDCFLTAERFLNKQLHT